MTTWESRQFKTAPFLLLTTCLSLGAFFTVFGSACALKVLNGAWWIVAYQMLLVGSHITVFWTRTVLQYRMALIGLSAASIPLLTIQVDYVLQFAKPTLSKIPATAYGAGYIILLIVQYIWIGVLGSEPQSYLGQLVYVVHRGHDDPVGRLRTSASDGPEFYSDSASKAAPSLPGNHFMAERSPPPPQQQSNQHHHSQPERTPPSAGRGAVPKLTPLSVDFSEKVEALHTYKANPQDPNELSFEKGERMYVVERKGNWWQARKQNGTTGIIPSNYVVMI